MKKSIGKTNTCEFHSPNRAAHAVSGRGVDEGSGGCRYYHEADKSYGVVLTITICRTPREGASYYGFTETEFNPLPTGSTFYEPGTDPLSAR